MVTKIGTAGADNLVGTDTDHPGARGGVGACQRQAARAAANVQQVGGAADRGKVGEGLGQAPAPPAYALLVNGGIVPGIDRRRGVLPRSARAHCRPLGRSCAGSWTRVSTLIGGHSAVGTDAASAQVARGYALNANLIFEWLKDRRWRRRKRLEPAPVFFPVEIHSGRRLGRRHRALSSSAWNCRAPARSASARADLAFRCAVSTTIRPFSPVISARNRPISARNRAISASAGDRSDWATAGRRHQLVQRCRKVVTATERLAPLRRSLRTPVTRRPDRHTGRN